MEKIDFKKKYKEIYKPKKMSITSFPIAKYITISGEGSPASDIFKQSIMALYPIAYTISMSYRGDFKIANFFKFVVPPLEGIWDLIDIKNGYDGNKDNLKWKIMIMMPDFVTEDVFEEAKKRANEKEPNDLIKLVKLEVADEKECCVQLHIGSFDTEKETFDKMEEELKNTKYKRCSYVHREIYLSDFRKTEENKLKTVLCFEVAKRSNKK